MEKKEKKKKNHKKLKTNTELKQAIHNILQS